MKQQLLGLNATDTVTGFTGTITGHCDYLTGCSQVLIVPKVGPDGSSRDGNWFDVQRIVLNGKVKPIVLKNEETPGPDKAPVRKY